MKKKLSILFALALVASLCLVPAVAQAKDVDTKVVVYTDSLTLENKDSSSVPYVVISDTIGATFLYNGSGDVFEWSLEGKVTLPGISYSLIYYADMPDRFTNWGGNNPGALIATMTSDSNGVISGSSSINLGMNLPCYPDANMDEYYYGTDTEHSGYTGDNYATGHGAKIWLVPSDYLPTDWLSNGGWSTWQPDNILFETDLITYTDTDLVIAISLSTYRLDFGRVAAGQTAGPLDLIVRNIGNTPIVVLASASSGLFEGLLLTGVALGDYEPLLYAKEFEDLDVTLPVPVGYSSGLVTGTLTFIASPK